MTLDEMTKTFSCMSEGQQAIVLARFVYELTVLARETYATGSDQADTSMTAQDINELQHRVSAAVVARLVGNPQRYPDDVLVQMCADPTNNPLALCSGPVFGRLVNEVASGTASG